MEKESLLEAKKLITDAIGSSKKINQQDRIELLINLYSFLNELSYENNIRTLQKALGQGYYDSNNQGRKR